jgi:hypothetical protein
MAKVGSWGKIVFEVSREKQFSFNNLSKTVSSRWNEHERIGKKPKSEFNGPDLDEGNLDIILDATLGIKPMKTLSDLEKAVAAGEVNYLVIGKNKIGSGMWKITKMSEDYKIIYAGGEVAKIELSLDLKEYR